MKISISNIAWDKENDINMYGFLEKNQVDGIEIAPTRIFEEDPYNKVKEAKEFKEVLFEKYNLSVASLQSIWYGRKENIFQDKKQREILIDYTKKAFEFAHALNCSNLVFGCPKNRIIENEADKDIAIDFFRKLGDIAISEGTVLALEANPVIYNTNFMNTTAEASEIVKIVESNGIRINYDLGTVIENNEKVNDLEKYMSMINHVHISEPYLEEIKFGDTQEELIEILSKLNYHNYVSIEMKNLQNIQLVQNDVKKLLDLVRSK